MRVSVKETERMIERQSEVSNGKPPSVTTDSSHSSSIPQPAMMFHPVPSLYQPFVQSQSHPQQQSKLKQSLKQSGKEDSVKPKQSASKPSKSVTKPTISTQPANKSVSKPIIEKPIPRSDSVKMFLFSLERD